MKSKIFIFLILQSLSFVGFSQANEDRLPYHNVQKYIDSSQNQAINEAERLKYALEANDLAKKLKNDSIYLVSNLNLVDFYFSNQDFEKYNDTNHAIIKLSRKLNDSLSLAFSHYALGYSYSISEVNDSAYYYLSRAAKIYGQINNKVKLSYSLGALSVIQLDSKDYFGAEENAIRALKALKGVEESDEILDQKWILYNTLGSSANSLKNYDRAIDYHSEAIRVAKKMDDDFNNEIYSLNNIAYAKREQGLYLESEQIFKKISKRKNLKQEDPSFYALILENLAFTKYLSGNYDEDELIDIFEKSYVISDSIDDQITKVGAIISMAKFYNGIDNKLKSNNYAKEAYTLAKKIGNNEIYLESMILLAELNDDEIGKEYYREYIRVSDSLLTEERNVKNKYARIEFETDQLEAENEQISKENLYLLILSIGLLLTAILVYVVISQRAKNRKLKLIQVQQKANEDIYNLMLGQQDKVEEARSQEKKRISEELHDGVLGRLFGTRLSLDSINFKEGKDAMMTRANYIGQLKTIEEDIRKISHELNTDFVSGSGFMDIVSELIENQTQAYGLKSEFDYTDDISWDLVSNKTKINIYRIVQESMQNIYKHANAKSVKISIFLENDVICLNIIDDGEGFDTSKSKKGIGLKNMTSRVEDINGEITFASQSGNGTTVNVKIPYN